MLDEFKNVLKKKSQDGELKIGKPGYIDMINKIQEMIDNGYAVVDIMLAVGEQFDRDEANLIINEAREIGIL